VLLILLAIVVSILVGLALGGNLRSLSELRLRLWPLAIVGLVLQILPVQFGSSHWLAVALLIASYVLLLAFVVVNIRVAGFPVVAVAFGLNLLVVALNGGMPVSASAIERASGPVDGPAQIAALERSTDAKHHLQRPGDVLTPLSDVIGIGRPISQVLSVGDLVFILGVGWVLVVAMRRSPERSDQAGGKAPADDPATPPRPVPTRPATEGAFPGDAPSRGPAGP
jgi:hypothetical protein